LQLKLRLQGSFQVLVEPVDCVPHRFLSTRHGSRIIMAVSHAPPMCHTRENLYEVSKLQIEREKPIQDQKLHRSNTNS